MQAQRVEKQESTKKSTKVLDLDGNEPWGSLAPRAPAFGVTAGISPAVI